MSTMSSQTIEWNHFGQLIPATLTVFSWSDGKTTVQLSSTHPVSQIRITAKKEVQTEDFADDPQAAVKSVVEQSHCALSKATHINISIY